MTLDKAADQAFEYLAQRFGADYATKNPSAALRFVGDWVNAHSRDNVAQAILSLQDVLVPSIPLEVTN